MNLTPKLQKVFNLFPKKVKETTSEYLLRLKKHIETITNEKEIKNYLKLYDFFSKIKETNGENMDMDKMALLEKELVPSNGNLYKSKKKRNIQLLPRSNSFEVLDPLKNSASLVKFYRRMIEKNCSGALFCENSFVSECRFAAQILDDLMLNNRDEKFLRMWIYNYITSVLKGDNATKTEKTSIHAFKKTFDLFNANYYG